MKIRAVNQILDRYFIFSTGLIPEKEKRTDDSPAPDNSEESQQQQIFEAVERRRSVRAKRDKVIFFTISVVAVI